MAIQPSNGGGGSVVEHEGGSDGLAEVVNTILDKGLVIDVFARVSLVGIEVLRIDARVVVASVDTYLRFAEAAGRLGMDKSQPSGLTDIVEGVESKGAKGKTKGVIDAASEKLDDVIGGDDDEAEDEERPRRKRRKREAARSEER